RRVEQKRRCLVEIEHLRIGIAVDVEAEQELRTRIALLHQHLQILLRLRDVARLQCLQRILDASPGGLHAREQTRSQTNNDDSAADSVHEATPGVLRVRPVYHGTDRLTWRPFSSDRQIGSEEGAGKYFAVETGGR